MVVVLLEWAGGVGTSNNDVASMLVLLVRFTESDDD